MRAQGIVAAAAVGLLSLAGDGAVFAGAKAREQGAPVQATKSARSDALKLAEQTNSTHNKSGATVPAQGAAPAKAVPSRAPIKVDTAVPKLDKTELKQVRDAMALVRKKRFGEAGLVARSLPNTHTRKLIEWMILTGKNYDAELERLTSFADANPNWPSSEQTRARAETKLLLSKPSPDDVFAYFRDRKPASAAGHFAVAIAHLGKGDVKKAKALAVRTWRRQDPGKAAEKVVLAKLGKLLSVEDHRARMVRQIYERDGQAALRTASLLDKGRQALARAAAAYHKRSRKAARLYRAVPKELRTAAVLQYARVRYWRRRGKHKRARAILLQQLKQKPDFTYPWKWWFEQRTQAYRALAKGRIKEAYNLVRYNEFKSGTGFAQTEFLAGFIALTRLKEPERALKHFERIYDGAERDGDRAMSDYWTGRTLIKLGRKDEASPLFARAAVHTRTFYGQLANDALGRKPAPVNFSQTPKATPAAKQALNLNEMARIIRLLDRLNEPTLMWRFFRALAGSTKDKNQLAALVELAWELNKPHYAVKVAKVALFRGIDLGGHLYPKNALPKFKRLTPEVDRAFVLGLARQESEFNPKAISHAGARGVMQLMPGTARMVARQHKQRYSKRKLTADPSYNVMLGSAHLHDLLRDFNGSFIMTAAGYNAGPGNVRKWVKAFGDPRHASVDPLIWVESITYNETRNYVKSVLKNAAVYRTRLGTNLRTITSDLTSGSFK